MSPARGHSTPTQIVRRRGADDFDLGHPVGQAQGGLHRVGESALEAGRSTSRSHHAWVPLRPRTTGASTWNRVPFVHVQDAVHDQQGGLADQALPGLGIVGHAGAGVEQAQVVVHLGDDAHGGAKVRAHGPKGPIRTSGSTSSASARSWNRLSEGHGEDDPPYHRPPRQQSMMLSTFPATARLVRPARFNDWTDRTSPVIGQRQ